MTRLAEKIRVEPLGDVRVRRIEQSVLASVASEPPRAAPRRRLARLAWAPASVALAAVLVLVAWRLGGRTDLGAAVPPPPEGPVEVATGAEEARLDLGDAVLEVGPETAMTLRRSGSGVLVDLARGAVGCEVEPRGERAPFQVLAGDVRVTVLGTVFRVERDEEVRVSVTRGKVRVASPSGMREVGAGESWTEAGGVLALAAETAGAPADRDAPAGSAADGAGAARDGAPRDGDARPERSGEPPAPREAIGRSDRSEGGGRRMTRRRALRVLRPPRHRIPAGLTGSHAAAFEGAARWEARDPEKSADWYRTIADRRRGRIASYALYSLAYLQYFELSRPSQAQETARAYLERFPRGREAEAARLLFLRAACRRSEGAACREAASSYLEHHPDSARAEAAAVFTD